MADRLPPQSGSLGAFVNAQPYKRVKALRRLLLKVLFPLPARGQAVHGSAVRECALRGGDIPALTRPSLLPRCLQRPTVAEREAPRQVADLVHGVEVGGRLLVRLSA